MAENEPQSKVHFDDFIAAVQPDPANPEPSAVITGYVGHGAEGHIRIFSDATLNTWYDVPEADVIHSLPIADSKLGGSHVWVRASAAIKPGAAGAGAGADAAAAVACSWPTSPGCWPSAHACPPAAGMGAPAGQAQTNPPTLGCSGGCNALGMAQTFTQGLPCNHAALVGTQFTNYFGCTAACAAPMAGAMAAHAGTNPPTLGCSGGCNVVGMAQTFTMGPPCTHAALVGTQFTNYFGCTAACAAPNAQVHGPLPPSGTMHQCCGIEAAGGFPNLQTFPPFTTRCLTMPRQCGVFNPFGQQ